MADNCTLVANALTSCNASLSVISTAYDDCGCGVVQPDPCAISSSEVYGQDLHIAAIFIVLLASFAGALLPLLAKHHPGLYLNPYMICLGKCTGTGVVIACALVHMLQPASQSLTSPCVPWEFNTDYQAYAFLYAMLAGLVMQFVEVVVSVAASSRLIAVARHASGSSSSKAPTSASMVDLFPRHSHGAGLECSDHDRSPSEDLAAAASGVIPVELEDQKEESQMVGTHAGAHQSAMHRLISVYMVEFGVTVHSIFIGLATGVVGITELRSLLVALCFHQFFEGVALGARLADAELKSHGQEAMLILVFSVAASIGLTVGVGVTSSLNVNGGTFLLVQGTFDGICGGLLLYLGFSLLLLDFPADMRKFCDGKPNEHARRGGMFVALWLGAGIMAFIGKYL